ncbi:MAG: peptidoglycan binding domain-containing protein, partial [Lachnospiraceae bacterium]|nr:peptidoglycan binding domain-containing protein [Lachnospiraceae bacterium]
MSNNSSDQGKSKIIIAVLVVLLAILIIVFLVVGKFFKTHYFPKTTINSLDASLQTVDELKEDLQKKADNYLLTITDRTGTKYHITGVDIFYTYNPKGEEENILSSRSSYTWPVEIFKSHEYSISETMTYDEEKLATVVSNLACFSEENMVEPTDAYLSETDTGYTIIAETAGTYLLYDNVLADIKAAISDGAEEITLSDNDYKTAEITSSNENLVSCLNQVNNYLQTVITYDVGDETEILDSSIIKDWVDIDVENNTVSIDEASVANYVQYLAYKYNTYADEREFTTHSGDTITIGGGDYGWIVDKSAEYEQLLT